MYGPADAPAGGETPDAGADNVTRLKRAAISGRREVPRSRWAEPLLVLCISVVAAAAYAMYAGQDWCWDQRNYHIYNVYAWLHGRVATDLAPGQIQTWLNPAPHLLQYLLIRHTPPIVAGTAIGALAGINGMLLWILARRVQGHRSTLAARSFAALAVTLGLTGSMFLSFLGTTNAEYLCSPFVLAALVCLTATEHSEPRTRDFLLAGACIGAACGMKLTNLVYALGMSATLLLLWPLLRFRVIAMASYAAGGAAGFVLFGGYWSTRMWLAFRNPMFPFYNGWFGSPWFAPVNFTDARFLPRSLPKAMVMYPFEWLRGLHPTGELPFREPRFAYVAILVPLAMLVVLVRFRSMRAGADRQAELVAVRNFWLHTLFFVISFGIWLNQFGIQRYVLPLELLTGVVLFLAVERLIRSPRRAFAVLALLLLFAVVWTRPPDWGHTSYAESWIGVPPPAASSASTLYVMLSSEPMSYVIPLFPERDRFVRVSGNMRLEPGVLLGRRALEIIREHTGPIRTLTLAPLPAVESARLTRFGLRLSDDPCTTFKSRNDSFLTCGATRVERPATSQ